MNVSELVVLLADHSVSHACLNWYSHPALLAAVSALPDIPSITMSNPMPTTLLECRYGFSNKNNSLRLLNRRHAGTTVLQLRNSCIIVLTALWRHTLYIVALWRSVYLPRVCWLVGCLTSQQHASVSQGWICHTEIEVADQTTSPSQYILTPGRPVPALTL